VRKKLRKNTLSIAINNILVVSLIKPVKDVYENNIKSLKKEIIEDIRRWKDLP
jgi:tRNA(Ser,Leu) C12 N-acetylase TAN1